MNKRQILYQGRIVNLGLERVTLPNGHEVSLEIIRHQGAAAVIPVHSDETVTLVEQYRHAAGGLILEIPAGVLESNEEPIQCAIRELSEEAQLHAEQLTHLVTIHTTPGFTDEKIHIFLGTNLRKTHGVLDEDEYLTPVRMPLSNAIEKVSTGEITDAQTICALFMANQYLNQVPEEIV